MTVRGLGCPVRFTLTAGQKGDAPQAAALIEGLPTEVVMGDTPMMPITCAGPSPPRVRSPSSPTTRHAPSNIQRHLIECCFSKLKQFRRVATRFEKTVRNYRTVVTLAAIILWLR